MAADDIVSMPISSLLRLISALLVLLLAVPGPTLPRIVEFAAEKSSAADVGIGNPAVTLANVASSVECASLCTAVARGPCSAFSVSSGMNEGQKTTECRIALDKNFTTTPQMNSRLYFSAAAAGNSSEVTKTVPRTSKTFASANSTTAGPTTASSAPKTPTITELTTPPTEHTTNTTETSAITTTEPMYTTTTHTIATTTPTIATNSPTIATTTPTIATTTPTIATTTPTIATTSTTTPTTTTSTPTTTTTVPTTTSTTTPTTTTPILGTKSSDNYTFARDGRWYKFYNQRAGPNNGSMMHNARAACHKDSADLVVPYPLSRFDAIQLDVPEARNQSYFFGIMRVAATATNGHYVTDDGFEFNSSSKGTDTNQKWNGGEPSGLTDPKMISVRTIDFPNATWNDNSLIANATVYMCRKDTDYLPMGTRGKSYRLHYDQATPAGAQAICQSEGGSLADVSDPGDFRSVLGIVMRVRTFPDYATWHGFLVAGSDEGHEGNWTFPSGRTVDGTLQTAPWTTDPFIVTYMRWSPTQLTKTTAENYLLYSFDGFVDVAATATENFLCQKPAA